MLGTSVSALYQFPEWTGRSVRRIPRNVNSVESRLNMLTSYVHQFLSTEVVCVEVIFPIAKWDAP